MVDGPERLTGKKLERSKLPEAIEVSIDGEAVQMGPENYTEILQQIKETLQPGMPVYIETIKRGSGLFDKPYTVGNVLLSDGSMDEHDRFNMLWGKHHSASAQLYGDDLRIIGHRNGSSFDEGISIPREWSDSHWNEGTFSPSGYNVITCGASGTNKVMIGGDLENILAEAIAGIEFVKDAVSVNAPQFYDIETYSVVRQGDAKRTREHQDAETKEAGLINLFSFTLKMLKQATKQIDDDYYKRATSEQLQRVRHNDFSELITMQEVCEFSDGKDGIDDIDGHRLEPHDYIVYELQGQRRNIGYLKTNTGFHGHGFFLPARNMKRVAKLAFDPDFVKKFYPKA